MNKKEKFPNPNTSIRIVRVGESGETQYEIGSLEESLRGPVDLPPLVKQWVTAMQTIPDYPFPRPPRIFRKIQKQRRAGKIKNDDHSRPSVENLLSLICHGGDKSQPAASSSSHKSNPVPGEAGSTAKKYVLPPPVSRHSLSLMRPPLQPPRQARHPLRPIPPALPRARPSLTSAPPSPLGARPRQTSNPHSPPRARPSLTSAPSSPLGARPRPTSNPPSLPKPRSRQTSPPCPPTAGPGAISAPEALRRASSLHFSQVLALSDESEDSQDEELDNFVMEKLRQIQAEDEKQSHSAGERANVESQGTRKRKEGAKGSPAEKVPSMDKKLRMTGNVILLVENNFKHIADVLDASTELTFLLVLREGLSQLGEVTKVLGSGLATPDHLLVRAEGRSSEDISFIKVELWHTQCSVQAKNFFWEEFIVARNNIRKVVYDGKALFNCIVSAFPADVKVPPALRLIDPIIGCWLLKPDSPVHSFKEVLKLLKPGLSVNNLGSVRQADLNSQMEALSSACRDMFSQPDDRDLGTLFYQTEMRILPALVSMERVGITVDCLKLEELGSLLQQKIMKVKAEAERLIGKSFNLSSPKQVGEVVYDQLKLDQVSGIVVARTPKGVKSTSESVLSKLKSFHPIINLILEHRQLTKYKSTYVDGILGHVVQGKVFTCWDQIAAATGRVTSVSPNLQAVPKGVIELGDSTRVNIRAVFLPARGHKFLTADFEQIEFRLFGYFSQDPQINQALKEGGDVFRKLAAFWLDKEMSDVTEVDRERTKRVVYALMYGAGKVRLSEILGITVLQAASLITSFYLKFSTVRAFNQRVISRAERRGYLTTVLGRRRHFPNILSSNQAVKAQSQRQAFNFLIQGSAADIAKTGLLRSEEKLSEAGVESKLVMMIHDEMVWQVPGPHLEKAAAVVKESLESCGQSLNMSLETKVKISVGDSWGEMETCYN